MADEKKVQPHIALTEEENKLLSLVDEKKEELIQLLQNLIRIDSRTYDPDTFSDLHEIFDFVNHYMTDHGFNTNFYNSPFKYDEGKGEKMFPNLIAEMKGQNSGTQLQFQGHLDVVPYTEEKWRENIGPLSATIKDEKIFGRGALDMKGGVACQMMALQIFNELQLPFNGKIQMWFVPDEEIDAFYGAKFMVKEHFDLINMDATIISEATGQNPVKSPVIINGEKGCQWFKLTFYGASGHGSMPKKKSNAINKATRFMHNSKKLKLPQVKPPLNMLDMIKGLLSRFSLKDLISLARDTSEEDPDPRDEDGVSLGSFFKTTLSFNQIKAGSKVNVIPDVCELEIDIRVLPGVKTQQIFNSFAKYAAKLGYRIQFPEGFENLQTSNQKIIKRPVDIKVDIIANATGSFADINSAYCDTLEDSFENIYEVNALNFFAPGSSDATHLRNGGVKNVFLFGPSGGNAHSANEFVNIEDLVKCTKVYLLWLYRLMIKNPKKIL